MVALPPLSQRMVGPCRGESHPDPSGLAGPAGQGAPRRSFWQRLRSLDDRINDCWVGDLLGIALLGLIVWATPVALQLIVIIFGGEP